MHFTTVVLCILWHIGVHPPDVQVCASCVHIGRSEDILLSSVNLSSFETVFDLTWSPPFFVHSGGQEAPEIFLSIHFPALTSCPGQLFTCMLGIQTQVLELAQQVFFSTESSP